MRQVEPNLATLRLAQNRVIWRTKRNNRPNGLACRRVQEPKKCSKFRTEGVYISPIWGAKTPGRIELKFFLVVGVYFIITPFKFGDDRFRGFWLAEGQSLPFPIYFEGRPYNTHTIVWGVIQKPSYGRFFAPQRIRKVKSRLSSFS